MKKKEHDKKREESLDDTLSRTQNRRQSARISTTKASEQDLLSALGAHAQAALAPGDLTKAAPLDWEPRAGTLPPPPRVAFARTPYGVFPFGLLLAYGPPNVGKTLTMVGFAYHCLWAAEQSSAFSQVTYHSVSEPRSTDESLLAQDLGKMPAYIDTAFAGPGSSRALITVIDSIGYAMRAYEGPPERGKAGAMAGGMDTTDQAFCRAMQQKVRSLGCCIGIVGETEVPFVAALEGLVEGMIKIESPGSLTVSFRSEQSFGARTGETIKVPEWALERASSYLGYGKYNSSTVTPFKYTR